MNYIYERVTRGLKSVYYIDNYDVLFVIVFFGYLSHIFYFGILVCLQVDNEFKMKH